MNGLAVVSQCLLREPFWHPDGLGAFRPSVAVAVQRYADNPKLTAHLKSPDFFGVKSNPSARFVSTRVEKAGGEYKITGDLTMLGKTNTITVPAQITTNNGGLTVAAKFKIDRTEWGMTYGRGKIDDDVSLTVNIKTTK